MICRKTNKENKEMEKTMKAVITVTGRDTVGIIAGVSGICAEHGVNICDITQSVIGEYFAMIMLAEIEGLTTMEYEFLNEAENVTYCYFLSMYRGDTAFWLVQFACEASLYEDYRPYFIEWAKTVDVGGTN